MSHKARLIAERVDPGVVGQGAEDHGRRNPSRLTILAPRCRGLECDQYGVASPTDRTDRHTASARLITRRMAD
jgi:hypothetical protein